MSRLKVIARLVTGAASVVALSLVTAPALTDGELQPTWLLLSVAVALMFALYAEVLSPDPSIGPRPGAAAVRLPARGRRGVYLRQLRDSVRMMETVGVATQGEFVLGMKQTYVDVSLAPQPPHHTAGEPYVGRAVASSGERRTLSSFLTGDDQVFAVIGGPGSGKTTLMRSTALALCHRGLRQQRLPVLLYLRDHAESILADDPGILPDVAAKAGWVDGKTPSSWIGHRLDRGGCLVMMDGLDEVADEADRVRVVAWISRQIQRYPRNVYLVTSRPHGYLSNPLPNANVLQIRRFTGEQISRFLHNWYYAIECRALGTTGRQVRVQAMAKADDLLGRLRSRPGLYDLAANPLLLTMIANVHRYRDALPGSRAALYGEMCQVLVHRRQEAKGLSDPTGLRGPQKEHIMQGLALTMMYERVRDMPIAAACAAIAEDLRGASTEIDPKEFLDEVRKSGLLIEREHDRYAFVHLTLQEYLAAAQIGDKDLGRLTGGVDDPWWRETTLLWAANADATPVVAACLKAGTVRALSLAFDCADEARTLNPAIRGELDALLADRRDNDPIRQRLITGVKAARSLREVIWLNEDTAICARPVSRDLYAEFARDERAAGLHMPADALSDVAPDADNTPAIGMWTSDAGRFVGWLNNLFDDGTRYRLPTATELGDPAIDLVIDTRRHTFWSLHPTAGPRLHRQSGATWPYTPRPRRRDKRIQADGAQALPYLMLALTPPDYARVRALIDIFTAAVGGTNEPRDSPYTSALDLALAQDLVRALALSLIFEEISNYSAARTLRTVAGNRTASFLDPDQDLAHGLAHDLAGALARDLDLTLGRARAVDLILNRDLTRDLDLARGHVPWRARDNARDIARALARDLDITLQRALVRDLNRTLDLDLDVDLDYARAVDLAYSRDIARASHIAHACDIARTLASSRDVADEVVRARDVDLGRARDVDLDLTLDRARDLDSTGRLARDLDLILDRVVHQARDHREADRIGAVSNDLESVLTPRQRGDTDHVYGLVSDLERTHAARLEPASASALALDLVLDQRVLVADITRQRTVIDAFRIMFERWTPARVRKPKPGETLAAFYAYLAAIGAETLDSRTRQIPEVALQRARELADSRIVDLSPWSLNQVRRLLEHVSDLINPILRRTAPLDGEAFSNARIELLAAAVLLEKGQQHEVAALVVEVVNGLVAIQEREEGKLTPNEVMLLVRA